MVSLSSPSFIGAVTGVKRTIDKKGGIGKKGDNKGKAKGDKSGGGKSEKDKNKGKSKGKLQKGLVEDPGRSQARRFGGNCSWCWRIGYKETDCW